MYAQGMSITGDIVVAVARFELQDILDALPARIKKAEGDYRNAQTDGEYDLEFWQDEVDRLKKLEKDIQAILSNKTIKSMR
jgi:hypothetical protein